MEDPQPVHRAPGRTGRLLTAALATATFLALIAGASAPAAPEPTAMPSGSVRGVSCDQLHAQIFNHAKRLAADLTAQGYSIDHVGTFERCYKVGKRKLRGKGYVVDAFPIPPEPNPEVNDYYWSWVQVVSRTAKGKLKSTISEFNCEKTLGGPGNYQPGGPC